MTSVAVIFDWDGTLADTREVIVSSFQQVLKEVGCHVTDEYLSRLIGIGARNMFRKALETAHLPYDAALLDQLLARKIQIHAELTNRVVLFEGVTELLNSLFDRVKIALATMSNREVIVKLLQEKGIRKYFDVILTADDVQLPKPNPEIFVQCAIHLRCQPKDCIVVEDSIFGVMAAKEANMRCIAIPSGTYTEMELLEEKPDLIVSSIQELQTILNFVFDRTNNFNK